MKKVLWLIALLFIGGIFFWYGKIGTLDNAVARVNGTKIELNEYQKRVSQQLRREQEARDEELTEQQVINLKRQVLGSMLNQEILYQEAKRLGIIVTDDELIGTIHNLPQFQQDGVFNFKLYVDTLRFSLSTTPEDFEKMLRENIAVRKLERIILSTAKVTENELKLHYIDRNGNLEGFQDKKDDLKNEILQNKRTAIYKSWMQNLQQNTKLQINAKLLNLK